MIITHIYITYISYNDWNLRLYTMWHPPPLPQFQRRPSPLPNDQIDDRLWVRGEHFQRRSLFRRFLVSLSPPDDQLRRLLPPPPLLPLFLLILLLILLLGGGDFRLRRHRRQASFLVHPVDGPLGVASIANERRFSQRTPHRRKSGKGQRFSPCSDRRFKGLVHVQTDSPKV